MDQRPPSGSADWHVVPADGDMLRLDERPTLLIIASGGEPGALAGAAGAAGLRVLAETGMAQAAERLAMTGRLDALLLDLRGPSSAVLLEQPGPFLAALAGHAETRLLVVADFETLEPALTLFHGREGADWLCEPDALDMAGAFAWLARGAASASLAVSVHDLGHESEALRLEALSAEVRRLAETIDRLSGFSASGSSGGRMADNRRAYRASGGEVPDSAVDEPVGPRAGSAPLTAQVLRGLLRARRLRDRFFAQDLFADPVWDIMLDLMAARLAGERVSVSSLCIAAAVPPTTALRWIRQLTDRGVVRRIDDPADGRRVFIELGSEAADGLTRWWSAVNDRGVIAPPGL